MLTSGLSWSPVRHGLCLNVLDPPPHHLTPPPHHLTPLPPPHHLGDNLLTAVSVARECGMVEPDHQAIMVKADSTSATPSVTFHLLKRGGDLADLLYSQSLKHGERTSPSNGNKCYPKSPDHQAHSSHLTAMNGYQQMEVVVQRPYHLIVEGKSFEAIKLYFPDLLPRVSLGISNVGVVITMGCPFSYWSKELSLLGCHQTRRLSW